MKLKNIWSFPCPPSKCPNDIPSICISNQCVRILPSPAFHPLSYAFSIVFPYSFLRASWVVEPDDIYIDPTHCVMLKPITPNTSNRTWLKEQTSCSAQDPKPISFMLFQRRHHSPPIFQIPTIKVWLSENINQQQSQHTRNVFSVNDDVSHRA